MLLCYYQQIITQFIIPFAAAYQSLCFSAPHFLLAQRQRVDAQPVTIGIIGEMR